ncbi:MAG: energy transducer TonB [Kiritimatiellia bacterium]|nr:energy transducer TonB [Kiritimatiellia bacterium]
MNREILMAFCFSVVFHTAVFDFCPAPSQNTSGDRGNSQDIVVLGLIELAPAKQEQPETSEAIDEIEEPVDSLEALQPEPANDSKPPPEEKIAMVKAAEPPVNEAPLPAENVIPGKPALTQGQTQNVRFRYLQGVMRKLENAKQYPLYAFRHDMEGTAEVEFTIHTDGNAGAISLRQSSHYRILDTAAKEMVARASPFEPLPRELGLQELRIVVPLVFRIDEAREQ